MEARAVRADRLQADFAGLIVRRVLADHRVRVAALGFDVGYQLQG
jgi:hypothetical protein